MTADYNETDLEMALTYSRYRPRSKTIENLAMLFAKVRAAGNIEQIAFDKLIAENTRLKAIETAAMRFAKEADESHRYVTVRTWATPEADPYLKLRAALGQPKGNR